MGLVSFRTSMYLQFASDTMTLAGDFGYIESTSLVFLSFDTPGYFVLGRDS